MHGERNGHNRHAPLEEDRPDGQPTMDVDHASERYPCCIVWTPIPLLTWIFPMLGHMGIATSGGVIRDFAGPYFVSEDNMAFGRPTKYWQLDLQKVSGGSSMWDRAVREASDTFKTKMHNLCFQNCHSHVATALNLMSYRDYNSWNMVILCFAMLLFGRYVSFCAFLKTWLPFLMILSIAFAIYFLN